MRPDVPRGSVIQSEIPGRLDALGWSSWHRRVIVALGITWILDGLEASLIANLAPTLQDPRALGLRAAQLGLVNSAYLFGQVGGALLFGHLMTDRFAVLPRADRELKSHSCGSEVGEQLLASC